jgi:hypothetical protein
MIEDKIWLLILEAEHLSVNDYIFNKTFFVNLTTSGICQHVWDISGCVHISSWSIGKSKIICERPQIEMCLDSTNRTHKVTGD